MRKVIRSSLPQPIKDSLDYCWKEGVAAQVMISIFDYYLIPYALFMGATPQQIGLLVAIPNLLSSIAQLFAAEGVRVVGSRHKMMVYATGAQAFLLLPVIFMPYIPVTEKVTILIMLVSLFRLLGSFIGPSWGSLVSDYLPEGQRGQYLGWRSRMVGISGIVSTAFWGLLLYVTGQKNSPAGFLIIYTAAAASRFVSLYLISKLVDMPYEQKRESDFTLLMFLQRFRESNFVKFIFFVAAMTFATQLSSPYLSVHMLNNLHFNYLSYMSVHLSSVIAGLVAFPIWGRHADLVGNAQILKSTGLLVPIPIIFWMFARTPFQLILVELFSGFVWAGFTLSTSNFIYDAVSPPKRVRCLGYYNLINATAIFGGASLGGYLAEHLPQLFGYSVVTLFLLSALLRYGATLLLSKHFSEVRASAKKVSNIQLFFSVAGITPLVGKNTEFDIYPPIRPPRKDLHKDK